MEMEKERRSTGPSNSHNINILAMKSKLIVQNLEIDIFKIYILELAENGN